MVCTLEKNQKEAFANIKYILIILNSLKFRLCELISIKKEKNNCYLYLYFKLRTSPETLNFFLLFLTYSILNNIS